MRTLKAARAKAKKGRRPAEEKAKWVSPHGGETFYRCRGDFRLTFGRALDRAVFGFLVALACVARTGFLRARAEVLDILPGFGGLARAGLFREEPCDVPRRVL
jgi:hypothetical protein